MCLKNSFFYQEPHLHVMGKVLKSINGMHKLFVNIVNCRSENISRSMCNGTLNFGTTTCNDDTVPEQVDEKEIPILTALSNVEEKVSNGTMSQINDTSDSMNQSQSQSLTTTQLALIFVGSFIVIVFCGTLSIYIYCYRYQKGNNQTPPFF